MIDPKTKILSGKNLMIRFWNDYIRPRKSLVTLCLILLALVAISFALYPALIGWVFDALEDRNTTLLYQLAGIIVLVDHL